MTDVVWTGAIVEMEATIRELASLREVSELHRAAGREPSMAARTAIASAESRIGELQAALSDRLHPPTDVP